VAVSVKQIDWLSHASTGKGLVRSVKINHNELLSSIVYPSDAYLTANYPHCDDWYDVLPPHGNNILPGRGGQRSILPYITGDEASVEFEIQYEWTGDHSQRPVCSLGGVSYVGVAQMDLFYEVQEDNRTNINLVYLRRCVISSDDLSISISIDIFIAISTYI
jgi:hypothetical protein